MVESPQREQVVGQKLVDICHSQYSEPEFIVQGIGPASFRSHFLMLGSGLVIDLCVGEIMFGAVPDDSMPGDSQGLPCDLLIGRSITAVLSDDASNPVVVLEGGIFLIVAHDGFCSNPLLAGYLHEYSTQLRYRYSPGKTAKFTDYWTEEPLTQWQLERLCTPS